MILLTASDTILMQVDVVTPQGSPRSGRPIAHEVIALSDDEPVVVVTKTKSTSPYQTVHEPGTNPKLKPDDQIHDVGSDAGSEVFSDTDSLIRDVLCGDDGPDEEVFGGEQCTPAECAYYKSRLHELGLEDFVKDTIELGSITAKRLMTAFGVKPPAVFEGSPDARYYRLLGMVLIEEITKRQRLPQYNTIDDVVDLLRKSSKIMVITGAGISTNLGIPDFRSPDSGFYSQMKKKGFSSPEEIFDLLTFDDDPSIFYQHSGATFAAPGKTSPTHAFIALLQQKDKLLTNYTQNIDNIEGSAGITPDKLMQCHGSWATATCRKCKHKVDGTEILAAVRAKQIAYCKVCVARLEVGDVTEEAKTLKRKRVSGSNRGSSKHRRRVLSDDDDSSDSGKYDIPQPGVMKPDITFFHEALSETFFDRFNKQDKKTADLVIVIGTSMKVAPVSEIPMAMPPHVPHVYISRDHCDHIDFDVTLLGDCDTICNELAQRVGWEFEHELLPERSRVDVTRSDRGPAAWNVIRA